MSTITTGTSATSYFIEPHESNDPEEPVNGFENCVIEEMHHYGDNGEHWCPTGFLYCVTHANVAGHANGPGLCNNWGTVPGREGDIADGD